MRLFTFLFLLSTALGAAMPLPAFAAEDKKELSEEEEIALMMEQLEQFKASWESKDQAAEPAPAAQPAVEAPKAEAKKPAVIAPAAAPQPQAVPTIKITSTPPSAAAPVQIKTQDGRILGTAPAVSVKPEVKVEVKTTPAAPTVIVKTPDVVKAPVVKEPAVKVQEAQVIPPAKTVLKAEVKKAAEPAVEKLKAEVKAAPAVPEKKLEKKPLPEPEAVPANAELLKKLNIPVKAEKTIPAPTSSAPAVQPPAEPKPEAKKIPEVQEKKTTPAPVPVKVETAPASAALPKTEPSPAPEKAAAPAAEVKPAKAAAVPAAVPAAPVEEEIVVVQDEAAAYRAIRQKDELKSAREAAQPGGQARFQEDAGARVVASDEDKILGRREGVSLPADPRAQTRSKWAAARKGGPVKKEPPKPNLFAETFYLNADQRLAYDVYDIDGFIFVKSPNPDLNTKYAVVTGFGGGAMKTRSIPNLQTLEEAKKWVSDNLKTEKFESVEIKKMSLGKDANAKDLYWVGQKAYPDYQTAQQEVAVVQSIVSSQGGDFAQLVSEAAAYAPIPEGAKAVEIKGPANFEREEELMLKYMDQLDIGEKLFGPFQGDASGESFTWQSFGESSWRRTNLDRTDYRSQVGFWTNRVVFKGMRFPMNTVDPFLESTVSMDSTSADFSSNMKLFAGLEWRPFARNPWLYNYRPWGGINILEWIKNFRFYVMYGERKAIKDPIEGSADTDLLAGVQIFYEWGVELAPLDQPEPEKFSEFLEHYFWGEYFGDYRHEMTNFGSEDDYNSWLGNSSITMGVKLPGIPLPENPINEELQLMPYMRFEHVNSAEFSFPYQNQYFVAAGMRVMPWRNYRFKENEWLSKTKFFGEFVGVGLTQHAKQDEEAPNAVRWDLRFGISFSSRRY